MKRTDYYVDYGMDVLSINDRIDKIFDDVESRTCENCKEFNGSYCTLGVHPDYFNYIDKTDRYINFGCNKFERKTDGNV